MGCHYEVRAAGQNFCFIGSTATGGVVRKSGRGGGTGKGTQRIVMELNFVSLFYHNQQVNSTSVSRRTESASVLNEFVDI